MSKKIVVSPCFNEVHFLKHRIPNVCEYLKPDYYILADGMFPRGPESRTADNSLNTIVKDYTLNGEGHFSFDYRELEKVLVECRSKYPNTKFMLIPMKYESNTNHEEAYFKSYNIFKALVNVEPDDLIFPLECDIFLTEGQAELLLLQCENLQPNHSLMSNYLQFFESPRVETGTKRYRRLVYKYGDGSVWGCYKSFANSHDSGIKAFHVEWIRPEKYFELRLLQLSRGYSDEIRKLREFIRSKPDNLESKLATNKLRDLPLVVSSVRLEDFPKHFKEHENFRYYCE